MKFIHLGDLHIGRSIGEFNLIDDQRYILDQIIELTDKESVDAVLIAGDVYDKSVPSEEAVGLFDYFLCKLSKMGKKTFVISGNHDSDERLNFGSSLFADNDLYISAKFGGELYKKTVEDEYGSINIYMLPFVKASQVKYFYPEEEIDNYDKAVKVIINSANIDKNARNILIAHQFVIGQGEEPTLSGSENLSVKNVGNVEKIGTDCFEMFDYVALGHIHSPQRIGRDTIRYSGSPLKYSLSEVNNKKSVPIIEVKNKGNIEIDFIPLIPMRDMRHIKGNLKQLLAPENIENPDDYIYVTLTDEDIQDDAMAIFQQHYPNTISIDYDNSHTRELEQGDVHGASENKSFEQLISDFYEMIYGCEIDEEEMKVMKEVAREAGVAYEAD